MVLLFSRLFYLIEPTALYGAEAVGIRSDESRKVIVLEMKYLRSLVGVSRMNRVRNEVERKRAGRKMELASRVDKGCSTFLFLLISVRRLALLFW